MPRTFRAPVCFQLIFGLLDVDAEVCDDTGAVKADLAGLQLWDNTICEEVLTLLQVECPCPSAVFCVWMTYAHHIAAPMRFEMDRKRPMIGMRSRRLAANPNTGYQTGMHASRP